ncbi:DNA polymerase III subunit alpha [Candidatus Parabeggiatoa sp. HSG14]|uniref:DNA polymerase III subunit alpha n=1 Tax=Candidatus Parabeggiatoa sp. HSG14 TaxID=3055593 RepID=UPI0025A6F6A5|nr:DNA polymerase III subunit alpha [Thiotrichales bacterium HSG14]
MQHFVHLHLHTEYSLIDGLVRIKPLVKTVLKTGMPACAVTDYSNLFSLVKFYRAAQSEGIKPIIGVDVRLYHDTEPASCLVLLCQNDTGYRNLTRLVSLCYTEGQANGIPYLHRAWLKDATDGLIALSGGREGDIGQALLAGHDHLARQQLDEWKSLFPNRFYLELQRTGRSQEEEYIHATVELALETKIPVVATNDVCFLSSHDFEAHEVRVCIHDGKTLADSNRPHHYSPQQYLRTPSEMAELFADIPEAIENTWLIAKRCNLELTLGKNFLPDFPIPQGQTIEEYFRQKSRVGLEQRLALLFDKTDESFSELRKPYDERLAIELDVVLQMGFPGYFLIVADFIQWAKDNDIPVGPGRGCLTKDALVYRLKSNSIETISIDKIKLGDRVLTHKNRFKKVTKRFSYDIEEDLLTISTFYGDFLNKITLTQDHKVYLGDNRWKKAQAITTKDWLVVPIPKYKVKEISAFDLLDYCHENCMEENGYLIYSYSQNSKNSFSIKDLATRINKTKATVRKYHNYLLGKPVSIKNETIEYIEEYLLKEFIQIDDWKDYITDLNHKKIKRYLKNSYYFRKFLGRWIGDGHIRKHKKYKEVSVVFHKDDKKGIDETLAFIEENGYNYSFDKRRSIVSVNIQDKFLHAFFAKTFCEYKFESNSKYIPQFVYSLPKQEILEVLEGYIAADGYVASDRIKITTVSKRLALQTRQLLFQIGIPATLRNDKRKLTSIPLKQGNELYTINLPANGSIYNVPKERQYVYKIEEEFIKLKVRVIKKRKKVKTTVYDFAVTGDNSYTTSNYVVHNSGAGSLVAYVLNITDLDPIRYDLLFERFLNPERVSMPDFDIDFCMEGRDDVINYVAQCYGRERVSQIITYGTMAAKAVVRDVGRVLDHPYGFVDKIAKLIPFEIGITLDKALESEEALSSRYEQEEDVRVLMDMARKLEGLTRNPGKHAGGVVISPTVLTDFAPLYCEQDGSDLMTQFDKGDVEAVGLVKFDFLGLRTLTIIKWALETINHFATPPVEILKIPLNDPETYDLLKKGNTTAVFQLESSGLKKLIRQLQPDCFEDIVALVALYRPGPLQSGMVEDFINRKQGKAKVEYPHPDLAPILKPTYGVIVYQEQVMQIAQVLAGYTLGGADLLRRAMGKKKKEEMEKQRTVFVEGAVKQKVNSETATYIFDLMVKFAAYGFNKSHSAAYALVSYQTAWLKAHYPAAFMAAVLSADMDNTDKVVMLIDECRAMKLNTLPPNINVSDYKFTVEDDQNKSIRYGLGAIKGAGEAALESIVSERKQKGHFKDLFDFCCRIDLRKASRRVLEPLIKSGALDKLGPNRAVMMASLEAAIKSAERHSSDTAAGQNDIFALLNGEKKAVSEDPPLFVKDVREWSETEQLNGEKESLGFYLSGHPISPYRNELTQLNCLQLSSIRPTENKQTVKVGGWVTNLRISTKRGHIAFITLDDSTAQLEVKVYSELYSSVHDILVKDTLLVVKGEVRTDDYSGGYSMTAHEIFTLESARETSASRLEMTISAQEKPPNELASKLVTTLTPYRQGRCLVLIHYERFDAQVELQLGESWRVKPKIILLEQLKELLGENKIKMVY